MKLGRRGFTLVEIMIVVAIIALLAAIAIPNLLRARHNANEAAAISALKTISTAFESYRAAHTPTAYPPAIANLGATMATPPYIDNVLAAAIDVDNSRQGYYYTHSYEDRNQYNCLATPAQSGITGTRIFFVDESGVIRLTDEDGPPVE